MFIIIFMVCQSDLLAIKPGNYKFIQFDVLPYLPIKIDAHVVQGISQSAMFRSIWLWRRYNPKVALRFLRTGCSRGAGAALLLGRDQTPWGFEPERNSEPRSWNEPQWLLCQWMFVFFFSSGVMVVIFLVFCMILYFNKLYFIILYSILIFYIIFH